MRKLLSSPIKMALNDAENFSYQSALKFVPDISLNLMAVKVDNRPEDYLGWCKELIDICTNRVNLDLLEDEQFPIFKKFEHALVAGASASQLKMARIAPWPIFISFIEQQASNHGLEERLALLDYIAVIKHKKLADMSDLELLAFAGKHTSQHIHTEYDFDIEWFASTKGAKVFHILLSEQPEKFDLALSYIPDEGDVTPQQYRDFVKAYKQIFTRYTVNKVSGEKAPLAAATRLLSMKRPDQFIALTNSKIDVLCQGLSIAKFNNFDFESYWQDMIGTLRTFAWWHQQKPEDEVELKLWQSRAVLIDLFMFADEYTAQSSNYIRLRDKSLNRVETASRPTRRGNQKLTVEELVDQALAADEIPEYIQAKRMTIINQVKEGKSVETVIGLMRAIFG